MSKKRGGSAERAAEPPPLPAALPAPAFDAHCHLDAMAQRQGRPADDDWVDEAMARARAVNVTRVVQVGTDLASSRWSVQAANRHPDVWAAVAVHPTEVDGLSEGDYAELAELAADPRVVAIGETGLDYYWDTVAPEVQHEHFRRQLRLAHAAGKPVMIHDRDAHADVLRLVAEQEPPAAGVVFHAFSGDAAMARHCVRAGYTLSFPGVVTFTNAPRLREALAATPISSLMVETDAPFLTPHPFRGRPNEPYLIPVTATVVSEVTDVDATTLLTAIWDTGFRVFGW